jgi:hypothetical protein
MKSYHVGDLIWYAEAGRKEIQKECPICFGKKQVTLILGNGDQAILPCSYCGPGYEEPEPKGYIIENDFFTSATQRGITRIVINQTTKGNTEEYYSDPYVLQLDRMFDTKEEAEQRAIDIIKELKKEQDDRAEHVKKSLKASYSWNAGYWQKQINDLKQKLEYYEKRYKICKERSKEEKQENESL